MQVLRKCEVIQHPTFNQVMITAWSLGTTPQAPELVVGVTRALIRALIKKGAPLQGGKQNNTRTAYSVQFVICQ
jgi:hypothetical protein